MSRAAFAASLLTFALVAVGFVTFGVAAGMGGWEALPIAALALILIALAFAASPLALLLAAAGRGSLGRTAVALHALLCALGVVLGVAVAFTGPAESFAFRGVAALVAALDAWGVALAVRLWRA